MRTLFIKAPVVQAVALALCLTLGVFTASASTAGSKAPPPVRTSAQLNPSKTPPLLEVYSGLATWYGDKHHGRKTASGERYDKNALTAAHKSLPLGTVVRVTNLRNGREVVVRITDRGPFGKGKVIDLSRAAATRINMLRAGVVPVQIEVLTDRKGKVSQPGMGFYLALEDAASPGKLAKLSQAEASGQAAKISAALPQKLRNKMPALKVFSGSLQKKQPQYFAGLGPFSSYSEAKRMVSRIQPHAKNAVVRCLPVTVLAPELDARKVATAMPGVAPRDSGFHPHR